MINLRIVLVSLFMVITTIANAQEQTGQLVELQKKVNNLENQVTAIKKKNASLIVEAIMSESRLNFQYGKSDLSVVSKIMLDQMVQQLKSDQSSTESWLSTREIWIELEGHTDPTEKRSYELGRARAEAVMLYLHELHDIPLHRMSLVSHGSSKPLVPNNTKDGRAKNRRVVFMVKA